MLIAPVNLSQKAFEVVFLFPTNPHIRIEKHLFQRFHGLFAVLLLELRSVRTLDLNLVLLTVGSPDLDRIPVNDLGHLGRYLFLSLFRFSIVALVRLAR